jgi:hypothetical protein
MPEFVVEVRTIEQRGITLPWERWSPTPVFRDGVNLTPDRPNPPERTDSGEVFVPVETLYELAEQDMWDSQFGKVLLLGTYEGLALEAAGLAVRETRGGYHRTDALVELIELLEAGEG